MPLGQSMIVYGYGLKGSEPKEKWNPLLTSWVLPPLIQKHPTRCYYPGWGVIIRGGRGISDEEGEGITCESVRDSSQSRFGFYTPPS